MDRSVDGSGLLLAVFSRLYSSELVNKPVYQGFANSLFSSYQKIICACIVCRHFSDILCCFPISAR